VEYGADRLLEHALKAGLVERRALHVLDRSDGLAHLHALLERDWCQTLLRETRESLRVLAQIELGADQQERSVWAVVADLGVPLGLDVLERRGRDDRKANQEHVGLRIAQRTKTVIVFLASGIPETKINGLAINHDVGRIVIKDSGDVLAGEGIGGVRDKEACLTDSSVTDNYALDGLHVWSY